jgi:hypothetical protein
MNLPQPDSGPDSNINSPYCALQYIRLCVCQNTRMEGENLPIDGKLLYRINKLVFTLEIDLIGN